MTETKSDNTASRKRLAYGMVMVILLLGLIAHVVRLQVSNGTGDFTYFYRAARAMRNGEDLYAATNGHYIYPPFLAFAFQPLTLVSEQTAAIIWTALSAVFVFAAALVAAKEVAVRWCRPDVAIDPSIPWAIAAIAMILFTDEIHMMFILGQTDCLMLLAFACALRWMDRKPLLAGIAIGATASIKYLSLIFVPYLLIKKNCRAALASTLAFVFFMALPATELGFTRAAQYTTAEFRGLGRMLGVITATKRVKILRVTMTRSVSITSAIFRLTRSQGLPDWLAGLLLLLVFAAIMTAIISLCRHHDVLLFRETKSDQPRANAVASLEWAVLIFLATTFSPQTTARHMVLLLLVSTVAVALLFAQKAKGARALLITVMALMVAGLSLPPIPIDSWRAISGPSWCAIALILAIMFVGSRTISEMQSSKQD